MKNGKIKELNDELFLEKAKNDKLSKEIDYLKGEIDELKSGNKDK